MNTLQELINKIKNSNNVAIIDKKDYRTFQYIYKDIYSLATKFAVFLRNNDVKKYDKIIIWTNNSIEYVVILLGCFISGVIVVPIDLKSNSDFVKKVNNQVNAKIIFQTKYKEKLRLKTIFTENLLDNLYDLKSKSFEKTKPSGVVEIMYTSGTTGNPKGVVLTNKNLISSINALNNLKDVEQGIILLSVLPLSHIFEQTIGLLLPLINQGKIIYTTTLKPLTLFQTIKEEKVTHIATVPRFLELIKSVIENNKSSIKYLKTLKFFICGGTTLDKELETYFEKIKIPIIQGYGMTETSGILTANTSKERIIGSVGKPIKNVSIKILDDEILAKGNNITQGYYKNIQKTKESFYQEWFKTGDLGYFKENFLYLKGRKKEVIATKEGLKVYPEDIEKIINIISGVKDSCVIDIDDKIHGVLLLKENTNPKNIIVQANKSLDSSQKISNYTVWPLDDFPRTTTLKIKKFLVKDFIKDGKKIEFNKKNKLDEIILRFSNKKISPNTTLQDLGLTSIDIVELISNIEKEFGVEIDEEKITSKTKVKELEISKLQKLAGKNIFMPWTLSLPIKTIRLIFQKLLIFPIVKFFSWPKIIGKENLKLIKGSVILVANHQSHFDAPIILMNLPLNILQKTCPAIWQEYFFTQKLRFKTFGKGLLFYLLGIFFNVFPLPQQKGYKRSFKYAGRLIDKGHNILIFPEGERTATGELLRFKDGVGILALEMKVPIIPIKLENVIKVLPRWKKFPRFARTTIKIGKPLNIKDISYIDATNIIKKAVENL